MQRAAARKPFLRSAVKEPTVQDITAPGIFCDCYGTLYSYSFKKDELLVSYLNAQFAAGTEIMLVSTNPIQVFPHIRDIGLNEEIVHSLMDKGAFHKSVLEVLIDDDPTLKAAKTWNPADPAFRRMMEDYLAAVPVPVPAPSLAP